MTYSIYEHKEAIKFRDKHSEDKKLSKQILLKYNEIKENPYNSKFKKLHSNKCPKCKVVREFDLLNVDEKVYRCRICGTKIVKTK